ncbi:LacI family DNA-binding transcriptional regulator [Luteococcus peritonei]|uniref:LacI family DNA-binding transcriptional regulator n=1 Tax=Luteococcus peritonei TaxID=88874 RepID=A0ABW4RQN4_9ACTN
MRRITIKDIAREAGVSPGAVSFALNDRPGVSEETRQRIKRVAAELGWTRSAAAAALSGRRAGALGLVLQRAGGDDYSEAFVMRFMAGVQEVLRPLRQSLVLQIVHDDEEEHDTYRTWWGEQRVDGALLLRPREGDGRPELLAELGMPGLVVGAPIGDGLGAVCADEPATTRTLTEHLLGLGHRSIAYVTGPEQRYYVGWRADTFRQVCGEQGAAARVVHLPSADEMSGRQATQRLVRSPDAPSAVIFDNELLAMGGVAACHDSGLRVGRDVAMASFEDSPACRMQRPAITALRRRSEELGAMAAQSLLAQVSGAAPELRIGPLPELAVRASSGPRRDLSQPGPNPVPRDRAMPTGELLATAHDLKVG